MDSLLLKKLVEIHSLQDTLIFHTNNLQSEFNSFKSETIWLKLLPFFGVIIGGLIAYFGQYFLKNREIKVSIDGEKREVVGKIFNCLTRLDFYLRELAYLEVDSKYQYYLSCTETGNNQKKALEEHYNDYKYLAKYRIKIAAALSAIQNGFLTYYKLNKTIIPIAHSIKLTELKNTILNLKRPREYNESLNEIKAETLENDIVNLKNDYTKNLEDILTIANKL